MVDRFAETVKDGGGAIGDAVGDVIEISNYCRQNCRYCGIRCGNTQAERYRLTPEQILECCEHGYQLGFRTFVMQGGEDGWFTDERLETLLLEMKSRWPDCAVTLSVGEKSEASYFRLRKAGADRFLLRHESEKYLPQYS